MNRGPRQRGDKGPQRKSETEKRPCSNLANTLLRDTVLEVLQRVRPVQYELTLATDITHWLKVLSKHRERERQRHNPLVNNRILRRGGGKKRWRERERMKEQEREERESTRKMERGTE